MAQLATATFRTDTGFATGLTPTVTINEVLTGELKGTFPMVETSPGNYIYNYVDGSDQVLYFFKFDAGSDDVLNRYEGGNNKIENSRGGGGGVTTVRNNVINKEQMEAIAKMVVEMLPKQIEPKDIVLDTKNIEETLGLIVEKLDSGEVEFDYSPILSGQDKIIKEVTKKIDTIKMPVIENTEVIEAIKDIPMVDITPLTGKIDGLVNMISKESKATIMLNKVKEQMGMIEDEIENTTSIIKEQVLDSEDVIDMVDEQEQENEEDFIALVNENDTNNS